MKFKNIRTETGFFKFNNVKINFIGVFETDEKELIDFLLSNENWSCLDEVKKESKKKVKKEEIKEEFKKEIEDK